MKLVKLAEVGPSPEQLKEKVNPDVPPLIIKYRGKIFEIRYAELRNLGLDHYGEIVSLCQESGLDPVFFGRACVHCEQNTFDFADHISKLDGSSDGPVVLSGIGRLEEFCGYNPYEGEPQIATTFTNPKNKRPFYAIDNRCVFDDSLVSFLAENGHLEPYRVDRGFNFKPIGDFKEGRANPDDFSLRKKSLVSKIRDYFKRR